MTLRDQRQEEFAEGFINDGMFGILNLCPRFGKIRTTINIFERIKPKNILIAYPDNKIKESWQNDFITREFNDGGVTYSTHLSLKNLVDNKYDIIVIDEIHLLSPAQIQVCKKLFKENKVVLGLTGTLSSWTKRDLKFELNLCVIAMYKIDQAIEEGVLPDYEIKVIKVPLDTKMEQDFKGKLRTEKKQFDNYTYVIKKLEETGKNTMFPRLGRMRIIQNSLAKLQKTKEILAKHPEDRILVFCGLTSIADKLGISSHHSKSKNNEDFSNFVEGKGNHLAVVKIGNTGVTYKALNRVIINYFDGNSENLAQKVNRCMSLEYNNPDKKAIIYIISSNEETELAWLKKALEFFDKSKIKYV